MEINVQQYFLVNYYVSNVTLRFSEDLHCMHEYVQIDW